MRGVSLVSARSSCVTHSVFVLHSLGSGEPKLPGYLFYLYIDSGKHSVSLEVSDIVNLFEWSFCSFNFSPYLD